MHIFKSLILAVLRRISRKPSITSNDDLKFNNIIPIPQFKTDTGCYGDVVMQTIPYETWKLQLESKQLYCADNHMVLTPDNKFKMVKDLTPGDMVKTIEGQETVISVENTGVSQSMYSLSCYSPNELQNNTYSTNGIISKNTATSAAYILWKCMFTSGCTVLVTSYEMKSCTEVLDRIKFSYEQCPDFLKPGAKVYNRTSVTFDNDSRIICRATTAAAGRGLSITLLYCVDGETKIEVLDELGNIREVSVEDLYTEIGDYCDGDINELNK